MDGFLVLINAIVKTFKGGNLTEISGDMACYTPDIIPWDSGSVVRQRALEVSTVTHTLSYDKHISLHQSR